MPPPSPPWNTLEHHGQMISFAQFGEDVVLRRAFGDQPSGFYVDVGANDPVVDSVTRHFYLRGWSGINLEPLPSLFRKLQADRPRDLNLNVAASSQEGELSLQVPRGAHGLATATEKLAQAYRSEGRALDELTVPTVRLDALFARECQQRTVDFLKVDAEGHEREVLAGLDLTVHRPRVLVVEAGFEPEGWEPRVLDSGYQQACDDGCNRYYVRSEEAHLLGERLRAPANVRDHYLPYFAFAAMDSASRWNALGPALQRAALQWVDLKERHPRLKRALKRLLRLEARDARQ